MITRLIENILLRLLAHFEFFSWGPTRVQFLYIDIGAAVLCSFWVHQLGPSYSNFGDLPARTNLTMGAAAQFQDELIPVTGK